MSSQPLYNIFYGDTTFMIKLSHHVRTGQKLIAEYEFRGTQKSGEASYIIHGAMGKADRALRFIHSTARINHRAPLFINGAVSMARGCSRFINSARRKTNAA